AQTGLSVYTSINVAAQKKAYEVMRAGLRWYDKSHAGWHSSYAMIPTAANNGAGPPTSQELASYKYPDWYRNDYTPGRYLMGLVTKIDQGKDEATVRFGNYTAIVNGGDPGWGKGQASNELKRGYRAAVVLKEVDQNTQTWNAGCKV